MLYKSSLLKLRCFDVQSISEEDIKKTKMYVSEGKRNKLRRSIGSLETWLKDLQIKVKIEELNHSNSTRTAQLLNKTNQMNLSTRRMTEAELDAWVQLTGHKLWTFRVSDKFGDSGLTGIVSLEIEDAVGKIVDFVLSCRVMGRKIEETMLYTVMEYAQSTGLNKVYANYQSTAKNKPCLDFFINTVPKFEQTGSSFSWNLKNPYPVPDSLEIIKSYIYHPQLPFGS
jgi:FkbH-like protein